MVHHHHHEDAPRAACVAHGPLPAPAGAIGERGDELEFTRVFTGSPRRQRYQRGSWLSRRGCTAAPCAVGYRYARRKIRSTSACPCLTGVTAKIPPMAERALLARSGMSDSFTP